MKREYSSAPDPENPISVDDHSTLSLEWRLLGISFLALFLELMLIRWVPSAVKLVAYFANLMLISSFLGLGLGALTAARNWRLFRVFPLILLSSVTFIFLCRTVLLPGSETEMRYFQAPPALINYLILVGIFVLNVAVFIPLGEGIGQLFQRLVPLRAYARDLSGSIAGTVCFGAFSFYAFSPFWGMVIVMLFYLALVRSGARSIALIAFVPMLMLIAYSTDGEAVWSRYHYITVHTADGAIMDPNNPPPEIRTMKDPPTFIVKVNQDFLQPHGTLDANRFSPGTAMAAAAAKLRAQYSLPYFFKSSPQLVAILGAGGGKDVEVALLNGAASVDAVEIDPKLVKISRQINASGVYDDPRVNIIIDDARAFLQRADNQYDLIVFSYLDSQTLFSSLSNIRLDGYVYTVESIRTAFGRLNSNGMMSLSFYVSGKQWLVDKLVGMVQEATGNMPVTYTDGYRIILLSFRVPPLLPPETIDHYRRLNHQIQGIPVPTDDWPYLYLSEHGVPSDYLTVIISLLAMACLGVIVLMPKKAGRETVPYFFLGLGFLLLQTKAIVDCSLYFGATWLVTTIVITGVLLMVFLANFVAQTSLKRYSEAFYLPLFVVLLGLFLVPSDLILGLPITARLLWTLFAVPLPIFFAGLIFSTNFRTSSSPAACFGANLIGATTGGFLEYAGMGIGHNSLTLFVICAYLASMLFYRR